MIVNTFVSEEPFLTPEEVYEKEFRDLVWQTYRKSTAKAFAEDCVAEAFLKVFELFYSAKLHNPTKIKALVANMAKMKVYKEANRSFYSYDEPTKDGEQYFPYSEEVIDDSEHEANYQKLIDIASEVGLSEKDLNTVAINLNGSSHGNIKNLKAKQTVSNIKRAIKTKDDWKSFRTVEEVVVSYNADGSPITGKAVAMGVVEYKIKRTGETKYKATYYIDNKIKWKACDTLEDAIELTKMFPRIQKRRVKGTQSGYRSVARYIKEMTTNMGKIVYVVVHPIDHKENKKKMVTKRFYNLDEAKQYAEQYY